MSNKLRTFIACYEISYYILMMVINILNLKENIKRRKGKQDDNGNSTRQEDGGIDS